ncbi:MAG: Fe-Mn family superoxide dismutase [Coxiellaceae bacterium]|nr:Fe-Mn family superoxide dismutase [Coxiellaceae bacterium]
MAFELPPLPYEMNALEPNISKETLEYHYGKHHKAYVDKLNGMIPGTEFEDSSLEDIVCNSDGGIFNNAAQIWNHTFYWHCMTPNGGGAPTGKLGDAINNTFETFEDFKEQFSAACAGLFGSGWVWLVKDKQGKMEIVSCPNAGNPMTEDKTPLMTCDVWEHAYYIDTRNARPKYVENFWNLVNWDFVSAQYLA